LLYLTRKAEFAASHYYHNPELSPEENRWRFGTQFHVMPASALT